jgi:hypothetical protein
MDNLVDEDELAKALKHNPKAYEILKVRSTLSPEP